MSVNASVLALLNKSDTVSYSITSTQEAGPSLRAVTDVNDVCIVRGLIFRNGNKKPVQVLVAKDSLVDIDAIFRQCHEQLELMPLNEVWNVIEQEQLLSIPAVPAWQSFDTIVDQSLLKQKSLLLDAGDGSSLIKVSAEDFEEMTRGCGRGAFSTPIEPLCKDSAEDESRILHSLDRFTELRIQKRLEETIELPTLPETAQRIIKLRADPDADISDLTNIVELDPSLSAQVVSWAASPYYSAPGKIKSVHDAIVRVLGFDMVLNLALGLALGKSLSTQGLSKGEIKHYWRNAVYTAAAMEGLVTSISREHRPGFGMAYLSGLLNNFGYLVMAEIFPPYLDTVRRTRAVNAHLPSAAVETHTLGISSDQIGGWLLANWNLPEEVVCALRYQSDPSHESEFASYAKLLFISKQMLANRGFGDRLPATIPEALFESLHLDREMAEATINNILESGDDLNAIAEKLNV